MRPAKEAAAVGWIGMREPPDTEVVVTAPARPDMVHVLRAVASSLAARLDFPYDDIDDLRISIDEACAQLLAVGRDGTTFTMRLGTSSGGIEALVALDADVSGRWPPADLEDTLTWKVLSGLSDEVGFETLSAAPAIRLLKVPATAAEPPS
jgi:serine/threonine-protein kinase RsbW